jgi:hypothetical protein
MVHVRQFQNLVINLMTGLSLLSIAKVVVESVMTMLLPDKDKYKLWVQETSPDFDPDDPDEELTTDLEIAKRELRAARLMGETGVVKLDPKTGKPIDGRTGKTPRGKPIEFTAYELSEILNKKEDVLVAALIGGLREKRDNAIKEVDQDPAFKSKSPAELAALTNDADSEYNKKLAIAMNKAYSIDQPDVFKDPSKIKPKWKFYPARAQALRLAQRAESATTEPGTSCPPSTLNLGKATAPAAVAGAAATARAADIDLSPYAIPIGQSGR